MNNRKIIKKFFPVSQYEKEESFLNSMSNDGWKLISVNKGILRAEYEFELCEDEGFIYNIEYIQDDAVCEYCEKMKILGWEEVGAIDGVYGKWHYFSINKEKKEQFVRSNENKLESLNRIISSYNNFYGCMLTWQIIIIISSINAIHLGSFQKYSSIGIIILCLITSSIIIVEMGRLLKSRKNLNKEVVE